MAAFHKQIVEPYADHQELQIIIFNLLVSIYIIQMNLMILLKIQPKHSAKINIAYVISIIIGAYYKIVGFSNLLGFLAQIPQFVMTLVAASIAFLTVMRKINQIDLNEEIEKDRNFEKIKKREKS